MLDEKSFIGYVSLDLYRLGRKNDTTMAKIRDRDVKVSQFWRTSGYTDSDVETGRSGETHWIRGAKRGDISLFDDDKTAPISGKYWWIIKKDNKIPPALATWGSKPRQKGEPKPMKASHYTVYPLFDMPIDTFKLHLQTLAIPMTELFKTEYEAK